MAASQFITTSGAVATSTSAKSVLSLIAGSTSSPTICAVEVSSDGSVTTGVYLLELVKFTSDGTGTTATPYKIGGKSNVVSTSKSNYSAEPTTATIIASYYLPAVTLYPYQWPLGRDVGLDLSTLIAVRVTAPSGTPNVRVNITFEE